MTPVDAPPDPVSVSPRRLVGGVRRTVYVGLGMFFVGLGVLGAMLPLLPTTPFLLLASFFFIRSSPRLNDWLLRTKLFGPLIRDWQQKRGVRPRVKATAATMVVAGSTASAIAANLSGLMLALFCAVALTGLVVVLRLPVVRD